MSVHTTSREDDRQTAADGVFESLRNDIISLRLEPGTKLSEVEIAKQNDVSRQPVREAFIRLSNMNLLLVRPQRATNCEFAFETIAENKAQVDRICIMSLADREGMELLYDDHKNIFDCLTAGDSKGIVKITRKHLSRLDETLTAACEKHPEYFEN